ncbi:hypothetical protein [Bacillus sp. S10(2024)]|uniref:hypothetical protein n=1 Tax=Bacillus sp. S10(2024) TaxID=3162886 RepID=UPI003D21D6C0
MNRNILLSEKVRKRVKYLKSNSTEWNQFILNVQEVIQLYEERLVEQKEILNLLNRYIYEGIVSMKEFDYYIMALNKMKHIEVVTVYSFRHDDKLYRATKQATQEIRNRYHLEYKKSKEELYDVLINMIFTIIQYCEAEEKDAFIKNLLDLNKFFNIGIQQRMVHQGKE